MYDTKTLPLDILKLQIKCCCFLITKVIEGGCEDTAAYCAVGLSPIETLRLLKNFPVVGLSGLNGCYPVLLRPLRNKLLATECYIIHSSWYYLFRSTRFLRWKQR